MFHFKCNSELNEIDGNQGEEDEEDLQEEEEDEDDLQEEEDIPDEYGLRQRDRSSFCAAFTLLDLDGDGKISPRTIEKVIISLAREPNQKNIDEMMAYGTVQDDVFEMDFNGFCRYLTEQLNDTDDDSKLLEALLEFQAVSEVDGSVLPGLTDLTKLRHYLKHRGMKLTDEELDYIWEEENNWMLEEKRLPTEFIKKKIMERL